jgi:hypothetical protein
MFNTIEVKVQNQTVQALHFFIFLVGNLVRCEKQLAKKKKKKIYNTIKKNVCGGGGVG